MSEQDVGELRRHLVKRHIRPRLAATPAEMTKLHALRHRPPFYPAHSEDER